MRIETEEFGDSPDMIFEVSREFDPNCMLRYGDGGVDSATGLSKGRVGHTDTVNCFKVRYSKGRWSVCLELLFALNCCSP